MRLSWHRGRNEGSKIAAWPFRQCARQNGVDDEWKFTSVRIEIVRVRNFSFVLFAWEILCGVLEVTPVAVRFYTECAVTKRHLLQNKCCIDESLNWGLRWNSLSSTNRHGIFVRRNVLTNFGTPSGSEQYWPPKICACKRGEWFIIFIVLCSPTLSAKHT